MCKSKEQYPFEEPSINFSDQIFSLMRENVKIFFIKRSMHNLRWKVNLPAGKKVYN